MASLSSLWGGVKKFVKPIIQPWIGGTSVPSPATQATTTPPIVPQMTSVGIPRPPTPPGATDITGDVFATPKTPTPVTPPINQEEYILKTYGPTVYQQTFGKPAPGATPAVPGATMPTPPVIQPPGQPATPQEVPFVDISEEELAKMSPEEREELAKRGYRTPITPSVSPETIKAQQDAEKLVRQAMAISPEQLSTQEDLDKLIEATKKGYLDVEGKPISLGAISGQAGLIEKRAMLMAEPLERKLARLQAVRTASLEASKFALERTDKQVEAERKAAEEARKAPETTGGGELQWDPATKTWKPTGYEKAETYPTSFEEWSLAGGTEGTGMTYSDWLQRKEIENPGGYSDPEMRELRYAGIDPKDIRKADNYLYGEKEKIYTKEKITENIQKILAIAKVQGTPKDELRKDIESLIIASGFRPEDFKDIYEGEVSSWLQNLLPGGKGTR